MYCTYCGAALPDGTRLCSACGKLLAPSGTTGQPGQPGQVGGLLRSNVAELDAAVETRYAPLLDEAPRPTVSGSYEHAWQQLKRFFLPLFVVGLVYVLIEIPFAVLDLSLEEGWGPVALLGLTEDARLGLRVILQLATAAFVSIPLGLGLAYTFLRAARGETPEVGDLFVAYRRRLLFKGLASSLLVFLCVLVGLLLLVVPGIIIAVRTGFYNLLVVDEGYGPVAALQESWERTRGYGWTVFGVSFLAIPILIIGLIALIVGVIPAMMLCQLAMTSLFVAISARTSR